MSGVAVGRVMRSSKTDALDKISRSRQPWGGERPPRLRAASAPKLIVSSQTFRVQNSKHSRPNNNDLTSLNPKETSQERSTR